MAGALMQLVAYGAQDVYLTGNPQITFFKVVYRRHTNFSMECIRQTFKGTPGVGARVVATISRNGDLVHDCFIKVPSHNPDSAFNIGHNMFDNIELEIGGQLIDKHYGHWMEAHAELTEDIICDIAATATGMNLVGGDSSVSDDPISPFQSVTFAGGMGDPASTDIPEINVPLRFWFCRHVGLALPLIALQYHEVNINVKFSAAATAAAAAGPSLWGNYIYLDTDERRRFAQVSHEYLIEQVQMQTFTGNSAGDTLKLNLNHPVKELIWAAEANTTTSWGLAGGGRFDILVASSAVSASGTWQLKLNGHDRFEKQETTYFTRYQPYKYHNSIPCHGDGVRDGIGVYSFALKPEEHQPSGTCNFSRIDNAQLIYTANLNNKNLYVYAVNYNVLRIMSGMGGLAYSN